MKPEIAIDDMEKIGYHSDRLEGEAAYERLLTVPEVCDWLRIKRSKLYDMTHKNQIPFIKLHRRLRFRRREIEQWIAEQEVRNDGTKT